MTLQSFISTDRRKYLLCTVLSLVFSSDKTKNPYILLENLDQLSNLNMGLLLVLLFSLDIHSN